MMRQDCSLYNRDLKKCRGLIENICETRGTNCPFYKTQEQVEYENNRLSGRIRDYYATQTVKPKNEGMIIRWIERNAASEAD